MKRDAALAHLRSLETRLRRQGVSALFLFGSVARDEGDDKSDIDLAFDLPPDTAFSLFDQAELQIELCEALSAPVDFISLGAMGPEFRRRLQGEMIRVF
jgi:predicted nucleotidyltransferase